MGRCSDDSETQIRRIPALLSEEEPENRQATKSGHIQIAGSGGKARASRTVFQATVSRERLPSRRRLTISGSYPTAASKACWGRVDHFRIAGGVCEQLCRG